MYLREAGWTRTWWPCSDPQILAKFQALRECIEDDIFSKRLGGVRECCRVSTSRGCLRNVERLSNKSHEYLSGIQAPIEIAPSPNQDAASRSGFHIDLS